MMIMGAQQAIIFQVSPHTELHKVNPQLQTTGSWSGLRKNEAE